MFIFSLPPPPNLLGIKIQTQKSPHSFESFETLKSLCCSKNWCPFFLSPPPNLLGIKIQKYKSPHNIDSFDASKSLFCSKTGVRVFFPPPPPHLIWIRFQKIIFSLLRKIFGVHFLLSSSNLLGIKIQKYKSPHNFDSFETLKPLCCSKNWCPFFLPLP